jgi:hypothetical protein
MSLFALRIVALGLAGLLGACGVWISALELVRPAVPAFPSASPGAASGDSERAATAALIGVIRGDLWADEAVLSASGASNAGAGGKASPETLAAARETAERAASLAPYDARVWLLMATIDAGLDRRLEGPLRMSYYTAPNDTALMARRLQIATRSDAIADPDLQVLVSGEIRSILKSRPDLKPAIVAAYRDARPAGRQFMEDVLGSLDPDLLAAARASAPPR